MYNNVLDNGVNNLEIFCSRGFNSHPNTLTIITEDVNPTISTTPFTKLGSLDVNISNFNNAKIVLSISNIIKSTISQNIAVNSTDINIRVIFRIRTIECNLIHTISPEYVYSVPYSLVGPLGILTEVVSESFDILFCDSRSCICSECITYILEYSSTLSGTIADSATDSNPLFSLSSSISNVSMNAIVSESIC